MKTKAWLVRQWCEPEDMEWAEMDAPDPGPGQVRIRNSAAALNFFDILQVQGKYQVKPPFPFTPGAEVAGEIDEIGANVAQWAPGDRVLAFTDGSGFAEHTIADAAKVFRIPKGMDPTQAASMPIIYQTSLFALKDRGELREGEWLLVHAGASGVGMSAIQLGRAFGARVIATASSAEKLEFARRQGAEHLINYSQPEWVDHVKQITGGRGADVIYDPVGGDVFDLSTKCIAASGRLLVIGFASGRIPTIAANRILIKDIAVVGALWGSYAAAHPEYLAEAQRDLAALHANKAIRPPTPTCYPLDQAPAAMRDLANRKILGKAALVMAG